MSQIVFPQSVPPQIESRNIYPMEWRVGSAGKLAEIYERAKREGFNPSTLPWNLLAPEAFSREQRVGLMYWWALLANFDSSGPAVFARALIEAFESHQEDPVRKCFFSITRDEINHEECCQRVVQGLVPGGPLNFTPQSELELAAYNNIQWLYYNGARYWRGFCSAVERYPLAVLFTSFMMGEVASSSLFHAMAVKTSHPLFGEVFRHIGRDEARHLQICMALLEKDWPGLTEEYKPLVTKQLRAGFVFLSMILWEPPQQFWQLPDYFLNNHRVLIDLARGAGLGVLTYDEQAANWRLAIARVKQLVSRWGIEFPAIAELDIAGVEVGELEPEDIVPVF